MTPGVGLVLLIVFGLICCVIVGLIISNRKHDGEMDYTLTCMDCDGQDFKEKDDCYQCLDCGTKTSK